MTYQAEIDYLRREVTRLIRENERLRGLLKEIAYSGYLPKHHRRILEVLEDGRGE